MSLSAVPWDTFDPLTDRLYYQVPYSHDDVLSSSYTTQKPDEAKIRRYEDVARSYLSGHAPLLITSTLRGPFDRASGFINPWAPTIETSQHTFKRSSFPALCKEQSPVLCEPATSSRLGPTQTTESSYLPSPESLNLGNHPYLERDEVARVEEWRDLVETNVPGNDEFWASKNPSSKKRARDDSSWLRRRTDKKPRTIEPELKLSSPVSIPDKNLLPQRASSPLSSLASLHDLPASALASSQPRNGLDAPGGESNIVYASQKALPSSSQRLSHYNSQDSRPTSKSQTALVEGRNGSAPTSITKIAPSQTAPHRSSSPAVDSQNGSTSSNDSSTTSSSSQSGDEEVPEAKQSLLESVELTTTLSQLDFVMQGPDHGEDGDVDMIDSTADYANEEAEINGTADGEDAMPSTTKLSPVAPLGSSLNNGPGKGRPAATEGESERPGSRSSVSSSTSSNSQISADSLERHSQGRTAPEQAQSTSKPAIGFTSQTAERSSSTSAVSTSSTTHSVSTTLVEDKGEFITNDAQSPHHEHNPATSAASGTTSSTQVSSTDDTSSHHENSHQQSEAPSTPQAARPTDFSTPDERIATQEQSPWMPSSATESISIVSVSKDKSQLHEAADDGETQSFIIPPEAQSPWMKRLASQTQVANDAFSTPSSNHQLPSTCEEATEEVQPQADADRSTLISDVSNADFSIRSFSSFMSPISKPRSTPLASESHLPRTPSLLAAAMENPWQTSSKPKKRVSWAPLPHEADSDLDSPAPTSSSSRALSPPPAAPIPDEVEEGAGVFKSHFARVKKRTDPVRQRLLPSASQLTRRSPETEAMAKAFVGAGESPVRSSPATTLGSYVETEGDTRKTVEDEVRDEKEDDKLEETAVDEVEDVLSNLNDFLTAWDVETDLQKARNEAQVLGSTPTRAALDIEIGGW